MEVHSFCGGICATNGYFCFSKERKALFLVDAPKGSFAFYQKNKAQWPPLKGVFLTHAHLDHTQDLSLFYGEGIPCFSPKEERDNVIRPGSDGLGQFLEEEVKGVPSQDFLDPDSFKDVFGLLIEYISTPGHSRGGTCFYFPEEKVLFSGDLLFKEGIGRTDLPGSSSIAMGSSLEKVGAYPQETVVYPGHGPKTTLREEKDNISYYIDLLKEV